MEKEPIRTYLERAEKKMIQTYQDCTFLLGDCRKHLFNRIDEESIDLTVTSPPYDDLRIYNGQKWVWSWAEFMGVASGIWRVTKEGGVVVWVVGDASHKGSETGTSFKQALAFKQCGFNLHDTMIWTKFSTPYPSITHSRYNQLFQYMFIFSKGKPQTFNGIEDHKNKRFGRRESNRVRRKDGSIIIDTRVTKEFSLRGNVWKLPVETSGTYAKQHPAVFPEQIAHDQIISWSKEGDLILDPFMGSGTTGKLAHLLKRRFIGCEIDPEYFQLAIDRVKNESNYEQQKTAVSA